MKNLRALTGWGRNNASVAEVRPVPNHEVAAALHDVGTRGALARGLGRCYGDAAQNGGGVVVRLLGAGHEAMLHPEAGTVTVPGGVSIDDLLRVIVPRGWFVPVTAGTRYVTVGGAIASDIHGKNHHVEGSFGNHVVSLDLLLADGSVVTVGPEVQPDLYWATVGGQGLTGIILAATFRLLPIGSSRMVVDTNRIANLDALFAAMDEGDDRYRYSVAWIDLMARGGSLGRSVLTRGDHATVAQLEGRAAADPLTYDPSVIASVPPVIPPQGVLNKLTVAAFNELWFRKAPRERVDELQTIASFFHPLDMLSHWNRLYGVHGLVQYQFVVPFGAEDTMRAVIERISSAGVTSFLAVLKRFGAANPAPLSFPRPGWTLALDVPGAVHRLGPLLHELDRLVLDAGGRHYLAKDGVTTPEMISRGYPRLAEWQAVQHRLDPTGRWQSDLSRRLRLTAPGGTS
ncbi:MAG: FAD-binding oxidoreductase [Actinomycetota bacterium]|nr:FAD-binding oxidoreductase [Actinomycetota bacterium]